MSVEGRRARDGLRGGGRADRRCGGVQARVECEAMADGHVSPRAQQQVPASQRSAVAMLGPCRATFMMGGKRKFAACAAPSLENGGSGPSLWAHARNLTGPQ